MKGLTAAASSMRLYQQSMIQHFVHSWVSGDLRADSRMPSSIS